MLVDTASVGQLAFVLLLVGARDDSWESASTIMNTSHAIFPFVGWNNNNSDKLAHEKIFGPTSTEEQMFEIREVDLAATPTAHLNDWKGSLLS